MIAANKENVLQKEIIMQEMIENLDTYLLWFIYVVQWHGVNTIKMNIHGEITNNLICKSDSRSDWTDTILVLVVALVIGGEQSH